MPGDARPWPHLVALMEGSVKRPHLDGRSGAQQMPCNTYTHCTSLMRVVCVCVWRTSGVYECSPTMRSADKVSSNRAQSMRPHLHSKYHRKCVTICMRCDSIAECTCAIVLCGCWGMIHFGVWVSVRSPSIYKDTKNKNKY